MARTGRRGGKQIQPIIRKEEAAAPAHHGGAWKVAYADFVTAMMAFFLIMWLLNATTEDQRRGLADYFSPNNLMSHASSGTGLPFGGSSAFSHEAMISDRGSVQVIPGARPTPLDPADDPEASDEPAKHGGGDGSRTGLGRMDQAMARARAAPAQATLSPEVIKAARAAAAREAKQTARAASEQRQLESAANEVRQAVAADPALAGMAGQIAVDVTQKGLRIQLLDEEQRPMFATGSAVPNEPARLLIAKIAPIVLRLPGKVSIGGYTDAAPYPGPERTNWELSAERANMARRMLVASGLPDPRLSGVTGYADHDLLLPAQPLAAANRRIAITVLRAATAAPVSPSTAR